MTTRRLLLAMCVAASSFEAGADTQVSALSDSEIELRKAAIATRSRMIEHMHNLEKARDADDYPWYKADLRDEPGRIFADWNRAIADNAAADGVKFSYAACATAAMDLRSAAEYDFEKSSARYREHYMRDYREDIESCDAVIELGFVRYRTKLQADVLQQMRAGGVQPASAAGN